MPSPSVSRRDRFIIAASVALVTAFAWAYLVHVDRVMASAMAEDAMMAEMGMAMNRVWTPTDVAFTFAMWAVMMVGMMAGSAAPVLMLFAGANRGRGNRHVWTSVSMFAFGYILEWLMFSACAALAQWALHQSAMLTPGMAMSSARFGGVVLIAAGAYQLTPWKGACLTQCRSPLGFLMTRWREGPVGALKMGADHGWYCLGCCWAVMCVLFVVGVMNLVWVAALAILVLLEKVSPAGAIVARAAGAVLIVSGVLVVAGPR